MNNFFKLPSPYGTIKSAFLLMSLIQVSSQDITRERAVSVSHKGKPKNGGEDMCSQSFLELNCNQGYTTEIGANFNATTDYQYSITVAQSEAESGSTGAKFQLLNCVTDDLDDDITSLVNQKDASPTSTVCTESAQPWHGFVGTIRANIPKNKCEEGRKIFSARLEKCKNDMGAVLTQAEIALVALLAICFVAGLCFSIRLAFKADDKTVTDEAKNCFNDCSSFLSLCYD